MAEPKDIAWGQIGLVAGGGLLAGFLAGWFTRPVWDKHKLKKAAEKAKGGNQSSPKK